VGGHIGTRASVHGGSSVGWGSGEEGIGVSQGLVGAGVDNGDITRVRSIAFGSTVGWGSGREGIGVGVTKRRGNCDSEGNG
jgi:hypothetical protein